VRCIWASIGSEIAAFLFNEFYPNLTDKKMRTTHAAFYFLYILDGEIKKFPLNRRDAVTLGRSSQCDWNVDLSFISRRHVRLCPQNDGVEIEDLESTNGTYINGRRIRRAKVPVGHSFFINSLEFVLKMGDADDFEVSADLSDAIRSTRPSSSVPKGKDDTEDTAGDGPSFLERFLRGILDLGLKAHARNDFFLDLGIYLNVVFVRLQGTIYFYEERGDSRELLLNQIFDENQSSVVEDDEPPEWAFAGNVEDRDFKSGIVNSFRTGSDTQTVCVFISRKKLPDQYRCFLTLMVETIGIILKILSESPPKVEGGLLADSVVQARGAIITADREMNRLIRKARKLGRSDVFILIEGESGTGKELFAREIHEASKQKSGEFVALNCAAIPEDLLEVELFGCEKGAFTGADKRRIGKLELASGGTLFLDEVGEMSARLQAKMLRSIQESAFYRLGGNELVKVDLRIVAATNKKLSEMVSKGSFREDLYYRLVHVEFNVPPLRERRPDINRLVRHFAKCEMERSGKKIRGFSVKVLNVFNEYDWPGNVRELENEVIKLIHLADDNGVIGFDLLSPRIRMFSTEMAQTLKIPNIKGRIQEFEKDNIIRTLQKNKNNKAQTARDLGISYNTLFKKLRKYGIQ